MSNNYVQENKQPENVYPFLNLIFNIFDHMLNSAFLWKSDD